MRILRSHLTYANVIATLALFLALTGGVVWAANKIGAKQLKANSVTAAKIKKNAVTAAKLKDGSVTNTKLANNAVTNSKIADGSISNTKIADGSVTFGKLATGTSVIATASGGPVVVNTAPASGIPIPLTGTTSFTPSAGVTDLLNIEARGELARTGTTQCSATVVPLVNGHPYLVSSGFLSLSSDASPASEFAPIPLDSESGPVGLGQAGVPQQIAMKVIGNTNCTPTSTVSVSVSVTQFK